MRGLHAESVSVFNLSSYFSFDFVILCILFNHVAFVPHVAVFVNERFTGSKRFPTVFFPFACESCMYADCKFRMIDRELNCFLCSRTGDHNSCGFEPAAEEKLMNSFISCSTHAVVVGIDNKIFSHNQNSFRFYSTKDYIYIIP